MEVLRHIDVDYLKLVEGAIAESPANMHELPADELRNMRNAHRVVPEPPEGISAEDRSVPAEGRDIPIRLYRSNPPSAGPGDPYPLIVYMHGGGFVIGNLDTHQKSCLRLCEDTGWPVVSIDYRRAPEHPFPAAPEDCYAVLCWAYENAVDLGIDPTRIALVGESAGGNLATVTALMTRDRGGPAIACQVLFYPVADTDYKTPSYLNFAEGPLLPARMMRAYWRHYLDGAETTEDGYAAPLRADSLAELPPAIIATAEVDVLRSEGEAYGSRLKSFDVAVTEFQARGLIHGFMKHIGIHPEAERVYAAARDEMIKILGG
jgi:acetyl esterase